LIAEAFSIFGNRTDHPPEPATVTIRKKALAGAIRHLGYAESPFGSNHTKFGMWYGVDWQPWCAIFCTYCYEVEAGGSSSFIKGRKYAYVPYIVADARNKRNGLSVPNSAMPGDLVCFDWRRDGTYDHVGLFERWTGPAPTQFSSIEGNTSTSSDSNGGQVMRRYRDTRSQGTVFVRVEE
jgi:CHAP domain